jgi:hypothetical protein
MEPADKTSLSWLACKYVVKIIIIKKKNTTRERTKVCEPGLPYVPLSLAHVLGCGVAEAWAWEDQGHGPPHPQVPWLIGIQLYKSHENLSHHAQERMSP